MGRKKHLENGRQFWIQVPAKVGGRKSRSLEQGRGAKEKGEKSRQNGLSLHHLFLHFKMLSSPFTIDISLTLILGPDWWDGSTKGMQGLWGKSITYWCPSESFHQDMCHFQLQLLQGIGFKALFVWKMAWDIGETQAANSSALCLFIKHISLSIRCVLANQNKWDLPDKEAGMKPVL